MTATLDARSIDLRRMAIAALIQTNGGHVGGSMSAIEIMRALYDTVARHRPEDPRWPERDRIILSKGHGCLAQYVLLASHGYFDPTELATVGKPNTRLGGHPVYPTAPGIEFSTGSLGHGLPVGVGMALELRRRRSASRVFVVLGDGELGEGSNWEALMSASHHRLGNLAVLIDNNRLQSAGPVAQILHLGNLEDRLTSFGCLARTVDGHDPGAIVTAVEENLGKHPGPVALICDTVKGRGIPPAENVPTWHYRVGLTADELTEIWTALDTDPADPPDLSSWSSR